MFDIKRAVAGAATGGLTELAGVYDKPASPDGDAYQWGGSPEAAAAARARYQGGADQNLEGAAAGYRGMVDGTTPSQAVALGQRGLAQAQAQAASTAASARGGAANALAATRQAQAVGSSMAMQNQGQVMQTRAAEVQAGLAGQAGIGAQYLGAETGMEQAQLGAQGAQDQARVGAEAGAAERKRQFWSGVIETAGKVGSPKG